MGGWRGSGRFSRGLRLPADGWTVGLLLCGVAALLWIVGPGACDLARAYGQATAGRGCIKGACPPHCCWREDGAPGPDCCCVTREYHTCTCKPLPPPSELEDYGG